MAVSAITVNGDGAESTGLEFSFNWLMTDNLSVRGSYSYSKAELTALAPDLLQHLTRGWLRHRQG